MAKWIEVNGVKYKLTRIDGTFVVCKYGKPRDLLSLSEEEVVERILRDGIPHRKINVPIDYPEFSF